MARFRGTVQGKRTEASRLGHKDGGLRATANGWDAGITATAYVDADGNDAFDVYATGGSNGSGKNVLLGTMTANADGSRTWKSYTVEVGNVSVWQTLSAHL